MAQLLARVRQEQKSDPGDYDASDITYDERNAGLTGRMTCQEVFSGESQVRNDEMDFCSRFCASAWAYDMKRQQITGTAKDLDTDAGIFRFPTTALLGCVTFFFELWPMHNDEQGFKIPARMDCRRTHAWDRTMEKIQSWNPLNIARSSLAIPRDGLFEGRETTKGLSIIIIAQ